MKHLKVLVLILFPASALAATAYNYFAPGGALSCTAPCTSQNVDLTVAGSVSGPLRTGAGGTGTNSALSGFVRGGNPFTATEISGDCTTLASNVITCTKTNGVSFAASATTDTTNAGNISTGILAVARGGTNTGSTLAGVVRGGNPFTATEISGDCTTLSSNVITCTKTNGVAFATSATTDTTNAGNISTGTLAIARGGTNTGSTLTGLVRGGATYTASELSGDVVTSGSNATTIQTNVVSNSKLAQMAANTVKCNNTAGLANALDCTVAQAQTLLSIPAAANPSGLIGLTAVNGAATTYTRSDATHAIDVNISPTWTGVHTFTGGTTQVIVSGGAGVSGNIQLNGNAALQGFLGAAGATNSLVTGATAGDIVLRTQGTNFILTTNSGASVNAIKVTTSGTVFMPNLATSSAAQTGTVCQGSAGQLIVDTTTTCLLSTRRVKQNIDPLDIGLKEVMRLRPVSYELKPKHNPHHLGRQVGLISEEVADIDERLISREASGQALGVRYQQLTAVLIKAIQEQQAEIDELKRKERQRSAVRSTTHAH